MNIAKLLGASLITAITILSCKKENNINLNNQLNDADKNFIVVASNSNSFEIQSAKIAVSKTRDSVVLSFAQQLLTTHTNAQSDLKIMGTVVGFSVRDSIDAAHQTIIGQLDTLTGRSLDSTYIHTQLLEQKAFMNLFTDEVKNGQQMNVKAYANTILQNIQVDYQRADSIATAFF
ncbi:DUF4142 domain-containing protein [Segetibacter koreensis]|uniref:DUF4142 domain-containing protein n=1 Tax=Segetibacter koreensis TaxID=398037 RepID=UPI00035C0ABC|nr:DUF4142 domain-containing protein [Segetibacter koreensis]